MDVSYNLWQLKAELSGVNQLMKKNREHANKLRAELSDFHDGYRRLRQIAAKLKVQIRTKEKQ